VEKTGGYRKPTERQRKMSKLSKEEHSRWFRSFWTDVPGASTRQHPAPFSVELAYRLIRMFSFVDDTVLDPFAGTFTTSLAAMKAKRNSVSNELDSKYFEIGKRRVEEQADKMGGLFEIRPLVKLAETV